MSNKGHIDSVRAWWNSLSDEEKQRDSKSKSLDEWRTEIRIWLCKQGLESPMISRGTIDDVFKAEGYRPHSRKSKERLPKPLKPETSFIEKMKAVEVLLDMFGSVETLMEAAQLAEKSRNQKPNERNVQHDSGAYA